MFNTLESAVTCPAWVPLDPTLVFAHGPEQTHTRFNLLIASVSGEIVSSQEFSTLCYRIVY